jgi:hypothetical protein
MLFFFRGRQGPVARAIVGVILLIIGFAIRGGALLVGIGAVLLVWGGIGALRNQRLHRQGDLGRSGGTS